MARDITLVTNINTTCNWSGRYVSAPTTERAFTHINRAGVHPQHQHADVCSQSPLPKIKTSAVTGPPMKFQII
jgi:hypothetical protein